MARDKARQFFGEISQGRDPSGEKKQYREKPTVENLCADYLSGHAVKKRSKSYSEDKRYIENFILPHFKNKKVDSITSRDVEQLHIKLAKTPYQANRVLLFSQNCFL
jgi:hypothetical protein